LFVVLAVSVSQSQQSEVLQAQEVDRILQRITTPFLVSRANADRFLSNMTDLMLTKLAEVPSFIKQSHADLNEALKCALSHRKSAMTHILSIFGNVKGMGTKLDEIRDTCPKNSFYVDQSEEESTEEEPAVSTGYQSQIPDLSALTDMKIEMPVNTFDVVFDALEQEIEKTTSGIETFTSALMSDKIWDAHVKVSDLLNSFVKIAQGVEAKRIENMKARLSAAKIAAQYVTSAYAHAGYLKTMTSGLSDMIKNIDYSTGPLNNLNNFAAALLKSLNVIKCAE